MSDVLFTALLAVLGGGGGVLAWRIAERVLAEREDAPDPPPAWGQSAALAFGVLVFGALAWRFGARWLLVPFLWFGLATMAMTFTDVRTRLIPDRISFRSLGIGAGLLVVFSAVDGTADRLGSAFLGAIISGALYFIIFLVGRGRSFGFGDVKLSPLIGLFTAFVGWVTFMVAFLLAFLIGGVAGLIMVVFRLKGVREHFAFGPAMVLGAYAALMWAVPIFDWWQAL